MFYTIYWPIPVEVLVRLKYPMTDGLLVPPGKASKLLTDHLITCKPLKSEPVQEKWVSQTIHTYKLYWFTWVEIFECHDDILMLGKSPKMEATSRHDHYC